MMKRQLVAGLALALAFVTPALAEPVTGDWMSRPAESFGNTVTHRLQLTTDGAAVKGDLTVTTSMPVPLSSWVDRFCNGNEVLEQIVRYRVTGTQAGSRLDLRYQGPKIESCTCESKCIVKDRSGSISAAINGAQLVWGDRILYGAIASQDGQATVPEELPPADLPVTGSWTTAPTSSLDVTTTRLLDLQDQGGVIAGTYAERTMRPFPLSSWRDRFCGGSEAWEMVEQWEVKGTRRLDAVTIEAGKGRITVCSCPQKCRASSRGATLSLKVTADGQQLRGDTGVYGRAAVPPPLPAPTLLPDPTDAPPTLDAYPQASPAPTP